MTLPDLGTTQTLGSLLSFKTDFSVSVHLSFISAGYKHVPTDSSLVCLTFLEPPFTQVQRYPYILDPWISAQESFLEVIPQFIVSWSQEIKLKIHLSDPKA